MLVLQPADPSGFRWVKKNLTISVRTLRMVFHSRNLLLFLGVLVCAYSFAVFLRVQSMPDIGIKSAFDTRINGKPQDIIADGEWRPQQGDRVIKVGDMEIRNWPDLLNAPAEVEHRFNQLPQTAAKMVVSDKGERRFVKVVFARTQEGTGADVEFAVWCLLDRLPVKELVPAILWFVLKILLFVVGVLVLWKRPDDPSAIQFYLLCVFTLGAYIGGYHWFHIASSPVLILGFIFFAAFLPAVTLHFYLVFPRPKSFLVSHRATTMLWVYGIPTLFWLVLTLLYWELRGVYRGGNLGWIIRDIDDGLKILGTVTLCYLGIAILWYLKSIIALFHSRRTVVDVTERNQVNCIFYGATLALFPLSYSLYIVLFNKDAFGAGGVTWPMFGASVCLTLAFIVSITRYRLMELDQILSSGVVYFLTSFLIGLGYYGILFLGTLIFHQVFYSPPLMETVRVSTTALILLLLLDPARSLFIKALDRRFHREKYHLDGTLQRMGEAIDQLIDPPTLVQRLLHAASDLLGSTRGAVYLRQGANAHFRLTGWVGPAPAQVELSKHGPLVEALRSDNVAAIPPRPGAPGDSGQEELKSLGGEVAIGLIQEDRLLAILVLGPKSSGAVYRQEDLNLLAAFSQITTLALGSAEGHKTIEHLNRDLQTKIEKIAEQQRRIITLQSQLRRQGNHKPQPSRNATSPERALSAQATPSTPPAAAMERSQTFSNIVGSGPRVQTLLHVVRKVAQTDAVVMIRGESGTGKQLLAQAVHEASNRAGNAFVTVHCAALSATLLESELFGHVKGAFTGAHRDKMGRFEMAHGGTLFLDEIGDISPDVQIKLLRVLQERTIERVGSSDTIKVDVRIVAATHQNLEELIQQGRFREDLYYRLNVFPIVVPALRERRDDIPELAAHFLHKTAQNCGKSFQEIDEDALRLLSQCNWPGNIRQLENVIEHAVVLAESSVIQVDDLPAEIRNAVPLARRPLIEEESHFAVAAGNQSMQYPAPIPRISSRSQWEEREKEELVEALAAAGGNKAQAARALGLARSTLISRLKKFGID
jgi:transcriptional regulator with GAF, ATPase, and Fis domain